MTRRKRTLALLAAVLCLLTSVAQAAGSIDLTRKPTLTLTYRDGKTALSGAKFSIYRVADADETGELTVRSEFDEFDLDIRGKTTAAGARWRRRWKATCCAGSLRPQTAGKPTKPACSRSPRRGKRLRLGCTLSLASGTHRAGMIMTPSRFRAAADAGSGK